MTLRPHAAFASACGSKECAARALSVSELKIRPTLSLCHRWRRLVFGRFEMLDRQRGQSRSDATDACGLRVGLRQRGMRYAHLLYIGT
jgi:hypothetical protein